MQSKYQTNAEVWDQIQRTLDSDESIVAIGDWWSLVGESLTTHQGEIYVDTVFILTQRSIYVFYVWQERAFLAKKTRCLLAGQAPLEDVKKSKFKKHKDNSGQYCQLIWSLSVEDLDISSKEWCLEPENGADEFAEVMNAALLPFQAKKEAASLTDQLIELKRLQSEGILTPDEFERAKEIFIGKKPDQRLVMESSLRSLKQLKETGILSAAEYEAKKWEAISK